MLPRPDTSSDHLTSAVFAVPKQSRTGRLLHEFRVILQRRAPYLAPAGAASAWGGWIYTEAWLTDPGWIEPLSYGGAGALVGAATAGAVAYGIRQPTALYGGAMATGTLLWSAWQVAAPSLPGAAIGAVATVGSSVPFWWWLARHRLDRDKLAAKAAKNAPNVNELGLAPDDVVGALAATGTPGTALEQMVRNADGGWTAILSLPIGVSPADIGGSRQRVARLQAALRLPPGWVIDVVNGGSSHHLIVTARPPADREPVELPEEHPILEDLTEWDPWQPLLAAVDTETGEDVFLHLLGRAGILIAGLQRMGKSVLLSVIVAHLALSRARLVLVDAKLVELSLWAPLCQRDDDFVGREPLLFLAKLLELQQEVDRRYAKLVQEGRTKAEPGDGWEPIALIVDELAAFIDIPDRKIRSQIVSVLRDLLSRGPACMMPIILATQKPEDKVVPSQIRDVCGQRVALATTTPEMTDTILGRGWSSRGAVAHLIGETEKGAAFVLEDGSRPRRVQTFPFEPPERRVVISQALAMWPDRPGARVLTGPVDPPPTPPTTPGGGPGGGGGGRPRLRAVPTFPNGERIPDNRIALWESLQKAGPDGMTKPEMVAARLAGHGTSLQGPLAWWKSNGWIDDSSKRGQAKVYVLTAAAHSPAPEAPALNEESPACPASL